MNKNIGVMIAATHSTLIQLFAGLSDFLFLGMMGDKNKLFHGQQVFLYEKRRPLYGCAMVTGEATIDQIFDLREQRPYRSLFYYWAKNIKKDNVLVQNIEMVGEYHLPNYHDDILFYSIYDTEYLTYMIKNGRLPESYNDILHDYHLHPEHSLNRMKARNILFEYEQWLRTESAGTFYNNYGQKTVNMGLLLTDVQMYEIPKELHEFTLENGKPFTRAPQYLTYVKGEP